MTETSIQNWFKELKRIWLEKDISALQKILASDFKYYEDPFDPPITSWKELEKVWQEVKEQHIEKLEITTIIDKDRQGFAHYEFVFLDPQGNKYESYGAYYLELNQQGKAIEFRQWWTKK